MSVKRLGIALVASLALAAVFAGSASATATTTKSFWTTGGAALASGSTAAVKCSAAENFILKGTVAGAETEIKATTLECPSGAVIKQEGEQAIATGTLKFSGLTVLKPAGCKTNASITTKALTAKTFMEGTTVYTKFEPTTETTFANVPLTECAAEGTYPAKGVVFGQASNPTGVEAANQPLTFSGTINTTAGGSLTLGTNPATISGKANNELVSGATFSADTAPNGLYNNGKNYLVGAVVSHFVTATNCYKAKASTNGNTPPNGIYWEPLAQCP